MRRTAYSQSTDYSQDYSSQLHHKTTSNPSTYSSTTHGRYFQTANYTRAPILEHEPPTSDSTLVDVESIRQLVKSEVFNALLLIKQEIENKVKQMDAEIRSVRSEVALLCEKCTPNPQLLSRISNIEQTVESLKVEKQTKPEIANIVPKTKLKENTDRSNNNQNMPRVNQLISAADTPALKKDRSVSKERKPIFPKSQSLGNISAILFPELSMQQSKHSNISENILAQIQNSRVRNYEPEDHKKDLQILEKNQILSTHVREFNHDSDDLIITEPSLNDSPILTKNLNEIVNAVEQSLKESTTYVPPKEEEPEISQPIIFEQLVKNKSKFMRKTSSQSSLPNPSPSVSANSAPQNTVRYKNAPSQQISGEEITNNNSGHWRKSRFDMSVSSSKYVAQTIHEESCEESFHYSASKPI